ncbi:MAG: hypothetical protein HYY25_15845 [Candidatus Wallbacteria bacterium]|nr:hypothetical protein [Candidatus Wallbacteria bacterium]
MVWLHFGWAFAVGLGSALANLVTADSAQLARWKPWVALAALILITLQGWQRVRRETPWPRSRGESFREDFKRTKMAICAALSAIAWLAGELVRF